MTVQAGTVKKLDAHIWEREADEHYVEPQWCSTRLFQEQLFNDAIYDPACGFGRILDAAQIAGKSVVGGDIVNRGYKKLFFVRDFLGTTVLPFGGMQTDVVTNPPFNIAPAFTEHAIKLGAQRVAIIFPTARLNAAHWVQALPLARILLLTPRPSMPPGHTITAGQKPGGGKMDFCWLIFNREHRGSVHIDWLRRDGSLNI